MTRWVAKKRYEGGRMGSGVWWLETGDGVTRKTETYSYAL